MDRRLRKVRVCRFGDRFFKVGHLKTIKAIAKIVGHKPDEIDTYWFDKDEEKRLPHVLDVGEQLSLEF